MEFRAIESNPAASPTASTRFTGTDRVIVEIEYQALGGQTPEIKVDLLNAKGDLLRTLPASPPADGKLRMPIPITSLANSTYVLQDRGDRRRAKHPAVDRVPRRALDMQTRLRRARVWAVRLAATVVLVIVMLPIGGAVNAIRALPDLHPWHQLQSRLEPRAAEITPSFTLDQYLAREDAVFREARAEVDDVVSNGANALVPNRYVEASRSHPDRLPFPGNRTQVLAAADAAGRRAAGPRTHRRSLQHALRRGAVECRRLLYAVVAHAGPRHRAGRTRRGHVGRLDGGGADGRAPRARSDRRGSSAGPGGLLERRRLGHQVRARCARRRIAADTGEADPVVADDWCVAGGALRAAASACSAR